MTALNERNVAQLLVSCLENEGVEYVFGLPGEENLQVIDAITSSSIRFITTRDERGAAFMADTYGALTGKAGVCLSTLGPGAINLLLGVANAQQRQEYGRGSVYVVPGQPSKPTAPTGAGFVNHFGRDSVYVTQLPTPPSSAPTEGQSNQQFGRESVYAKGSPYSPSGSDGQTSVGAADRMLADTLRYAMERRQFGQPIAEFQLVQAMLADSKTELYAARCMVLDAAKRRDQGENVNTEASCAKLFASETAMFNAHAALQIHGGMGYSKEMPLERFFRDAKITEIYEGTSEIQRLVIARQETGLRQLPTPCYGDR